MKFNDMKLTRILAAICSISMLLSISGCTNDVQDEKAKYVFLFIGDGMGMTHVATAESYLSYQQGKLGGEMLTMTQFPVFGTATSYSANSNVTDSAASGSAIASGEKANNYTLGVDAEGENVKSMAYDFHEDGYQVGILSTVPINHATPAAFYAHSTDRHEYYGISKQIIDSQFDFFAGAGFIDFKGKNKEKSPIDEYLEENGYIVAYGIEEFKAETVGKEKVIFCQESNRAESAKNYVSSATIKEDATLGQMLTLGLEHFDTEKPFFFMCEGGNIDWSAHANRTMPMIMNILEFDEAVRIAYEFYLAHPEETLIVVTADHETGGITLGCGSDKIDWKLLEDKWNEKKELSDEENAQINGKASIGWTTGSHTGGPVPVFAIGKGAERFAGRMDNTDIKGKILNNK